MFSMGRSDARVLGEICYKKCLRTLGKNFRCNRLQFRDLISAKGTWVNIKKKLGDYF